MSLAMTIWIAVAVVAVVIVSLRVLHSLLPRCGREYKKRNNARRPAVHNQWVIHDPASHRWFEIGSEAEECYLPGNRCNQ